MSLLENCRLLARSALPSELCRSQRLLRPICAHQHRIVVESNESVESVNMGGEPVEPVMYSSVEPV